MPVIKGFSEIDGVACAVTVYEIEPFPVVVHISINGSRPLKLTMPEATAMRTALGRALDRFPDTDGETVH
jgi:hypothetical protein